MGHNSDPPSDVCLTCDAWRGWRTYAKWSVILVPLALTLILAAGGGAATSLVRDAETRASVAAAAKAQDRACDERQRISARQAAITAKAATDAQQQTVILGDIKTTLARIEERQKAQDQRPRSRRRTP